MESTKVSVIINCLNGEKFLRQAIASVLHQSYQSWELIIWDNASTDSTAQIAQSYGDVLMYYRSAKTDALGTARNRALAHAKGEYVAFLDCDDVWGKSFLQETVNVLDLSADFGMVYSDGYRINECGVIIGRCFDGVQCYRGECFEELFKSGLAPTPSAVLFCRASLEEVGGFDARLDICEDYDLYLKVAKQFYVEHIPGPLISYRLHGNNSVNKADVLARENRKILDYWVKQDPGLLSKYSADIEYREFKMQCKLALFYFKRGELSYFTRSIVFAARVIMKRPLVWLELAGSLAKRRIVKHYRLTLMKYS